jgi:hypothetical protein
MRARQLRHLSVKIPRSTAFALGGESNGNGQLPGRARANLCDFQRCQVSASTSEQHKDFFSVCVQNR